jgi:hypothetical protein
MRILNEIKKILKGKSFQEFLKTENSIGKIIFLGAVLAAVTDYLYGKYQIYKNKKDPSQYQDPRKD